MRNITFISAVCAAIVVASASLLTACSCSCPSAPPTTVVTPGQPSTIITPEH